MTECIDARGLSWPQPWTMVEQAMAAGATRIALFVDEAWAESVQAAAERAGWRVVAEETLEGWHLDLSR